MKAVLCNPVEGQKQNVKGLRKYLGAYIQDVKVTVKVKRDGKVVITFPDHFLAAIETLVEKYGYWASEVMSPTLTIRECIDYADAIAALRQSDIDLAVIVQEQGVKTFCTIFAQPFLKFRLEQTDFTRLEDEGKYPKYSFGGHLTSVTAELKKLGYKDILS